jgi:hypothetical protein
MKAIGLFERLRKEVNTVKTGRELCTFKKRDGRRVNILKTQHGNQIASNTANHCEGHSALVVTR